MKLRNIPVLSTGRKSFCEAPAFVRRSTIPEASLVYASSRRRLIYCFCFSICACICWTLRSPGLESRVFGSQPRVMPASKLKNIFSPFTKSRTERLLKTGIEYPPTFDRTRTAVE